MTKLPGILFSVPYFIGTPGIWAWALMLLVMAINLVREPMRPMPMRRALHAVRPANRIHYA